MSNIIKHFIINNSKEAVEILKSAGNEELFEKAHKDGDVHPKDPDWVWVSSANKGRGDWRKKGGRIHTAHMGTNNVVSKNQSDDNKATQSKQTSKIKIDETTIDQSEYKRMYDQAKNADDKSRSFGLSSINTSIKDTKKELEDTIANKPSAKASISKLQEKLTKLISQKKAAEDVIAESKNQSKNKASKSAKTDAEKQRITDDITQIFPDENHLKHKDDDYLNKMLNLSDKLAKDENLEANKRQKAFKWRNLIKDEISIREAVKESEKESKKLIEKVKSAKSPDDLLKIVKKDKHFVMRNLDYVDTYQYHKLNTEDGHEFIIEIKDKKPLSVSGGWLVNGAREYSTSKDSFETKKEIVTKYLEEATKIEKRIAKGKQTLRVKHPYSDVYVVTFNKRIDAPEYGIKSNAMNGLDALKKYESEFNKILIYKDEKAAKAVAKGIEDYNKGTINHHRMDEIRKIYDTALIL